MSEKRTPEENVQSWATSVSVRRSMLSNRSSDTGPELGLRRALHARGLRYRKDHRIVLPAQRVRPDVVFTRLKIAVFVDGCFWHVCPEHGSTPKTNVSYWEPKLAANVMRDRAGDEALSEAGWLVVRVWEHEPSEAAAEKVKRVVLSRRNAMIH